MQGYEAATYGDRIAEIYDDLYRERLDPTDAVDLLAELAEGGRALELGIGTGRVALPLAARGVDVAGIDNSEAMVARLRSKPGGEDIPVTIGDLADVGAEGRFSLVYVAFTTFFALTTQDEQIRCLENVAKRLEEAGRLVLDAFVPDPTRFGPSNQELVTEDMTVDWVLLAAMRHDPLEQIVEGHHLVLSDSGVRLYPLRIRYCWVSELDVMARLAGFALEARFGDYDRRPFGPDSDRHVSVYRKRP